MKPKKTLSSQLTTRYLLVIRNEDNFEEKTTISFNYAKLLVITTASFLLLFCLCLYLSSTILARWFHPVVREAQTNKKLLLLSAQVDSLSQQLAYRDQFLRSINNVISGNPNTRREDSVATARNGVAKSPKAAKLDELAPADAALRKEFESIRTGPVRTVAYEAQGNRRELLLFEPVVTGIVSQKYDAKSGHYGVDLLAAKDASIKSVADGTVIFSSWTYDTGHVIAIQHAGNMVSVYKHNSVLLQKTGALVRAGQAIAVIGNSGELTTGPHLHFELWYNSNPVDPEQFIHF